jgi:hypothetical protein
MDWLKPPNLFEVLIAIAIGTSPSWGGPFLASDVPLWTAVTMIVLAIATLIGIGSLRRQKMAGRQRDLREERWQQQVLERLDRLERTNGSDSGPGGIDRGA